MKDTRSFEIKKLIKKHYPNAKVSVRIDKYSMGESINIQTDLIKRERIEDPRGYGYTEPFTEESKANLAKLNSILRTYESVDRDENGDILSGANTFLFIEAL
jgi:hypothetical protein